MEQRDPISVDGHRCFSKFGWIEPLKDKRGESVAHAFEKIFKSGRQPRLLWTDKGFEFYNSNVKRLLSKHNIELYSTENEEKIKFRC